MLDKFRVIAPNGEVYDVNAPDGATEADAIAYVQSRQAPKPRSLPKRSPPSKPSMLSGALSTARDLAGSFVEGVTGSWGDEVYAAGAATRAATERALGRKGILSSAKAFDRAQASFAEGQDRFHRNSPVTAKLATGAGIAASLALPAAGVVRGASAGARIAASAKTGASYGALTGAGTGEGTERIRGALQGATAGGIIGGAAEPVVRGALSVAGNVRNAVVPYVSRQGGRKLARKAAERQVGHTLARGALSPSEASSAVQDRSRLGVLASVSDLTDDTRALTGFAARGTGPGQAAVRQAIENRQANMAERTRGHIEASLGSLANPHAQSGALSSQALEAARPLYAEAYQTPITMTPALREFADSPVGPAALEAGANQVRLTPSSQRNLGSEQPFVPGVLYDPQLGSYRSGDVPVLETWDGAKRYLDDMEFQTDSKFLPTPQGMTSDTRALDLRRRELLEELDAQAPAFAQARAAHAGPIQDRRAFQVGLEDVPGSARRNANDAAAQMGGMSTSQLDQFRLGDRTRLGDVVHGSSRWADATSPIIGNDARMSLIRSIHGDDAADQLFARADAERQSHLTYREVQGSRRAGRMGEEDLDAANGLQAAGQLATGHPFRAAWTLLTDTKRGGFGRYATDLKRELGEMLTATNVQDVEQAMRLVEQRAQTDAAFAARLQRATAELGRVGTIQAAGNSGDKTGMYGPMKDYHD